MTHVVVTGSTRGIGYGLARSFLERGCTVTICGRSDPAATVDELAAAYPREHIHGQACDVSQVEQVQALWDAAAERFGRIDYWINNAGLGQMYKPAWEIEPQQMAAIVQANLLGTMYGTTVAYRGMCAQGNGQIFNMEGFGSSGRKNPGLTIYGATKAAITYYTESFVNELPEDSPVKVGRLSPGMVVTDLLTDAYESEAAFEERKGILSILSDRVETVTPWLVEKILANDAQGASISWMNTPKLLWRFISSRFQERNVFD